MRVRRAGRHFETDPGPRDPQWSTDWTGAAYGRPPRADGKRARLGIGFAGHGDLGGAEPVEQGEGDRRDDQVDQEDDECLRDAVAIEVDRYCRLPEERSRGLAPHSAAKDASLPRRSGLSPIVISKVTAVSADARHGEQLRGVVFHEPGQAVFQVLDLLGELPDSLGPQT